DNRLPDPAEEHGQNRNLPNPGMLPATIWDEPQAQLPPARGRGAKTPLIYAPRDGGGGGLAFASEIPALLDLLDHVPRYSPTALADYLRLSFIPHPETVYEGVFALPPGCTLTFSPGETPRVAPYWTPTWPAPFSGNRADAMEELDQRLREAVAL